VHLAETRLVGALSRDQEYRYQVKGGISTVSSNTCLPLVVLAPLQSVWLGLPSAVSVLQK
jgi:hypothetical protein